MLHAQMMGNQPVIDHPARFQIIRYEGHTNRATVIAPPVVINPVIKVVVPSAKTITFSVILSVTLLPSHTEGKPPTQKADSSVPPPRSEEHTSELQSRGHLVCRLL